MLINTLDFSFLFFSDIEKTTSDSARYDFMRQIVKFADGDQFTAVYFPERHFHEFGAIYTNPALLAAWLIPQTHHLRFRTAGISLPLHHPAEIVEWWATNDILSGGRIDLGFGSGWNKADFIYAPENFSIRKSHLHEMIEQVKKLWRGENVDFMGPEQTTYSIKCFPKPLQKELNVWLLVAQNEAAFEFAGRAGYNIFTMLYGYDIEALRKKILLYRQARLAAGFDPHKGIVTLMLHTLIMSDLDLLKSKVEVPLKSYIKSSFAAQIKSREQVDHLDMNEEMQQKVVDYAFHRYFTTGTLFGDVSHCQKILMAASNVGVNEIAFLVDFGVDYETVLNSLGHIKTLISEFNCERVN